MSDRMETQTAKTELRGKRHEVTIVASGAGVSWKRSSDGTGVREFRASTSPGAKHLELRTTERHFPEGRNKRVTRRETSIDLTRESALALRNLLDIMLGEVGA